MTDLVSLYKSGKLQGAISEEQILDIWNEIKKDSPTLLTMLNQLTDGKSFSQNELLSFEEKLNIYSKLTNLLCKVHLRKEVHYFDDALNSFLDLSQRGAIPDLDYVHLPLTNEFAVVKDNKVIFKTPGVSLFHILTKILFKKKDDESLFLYYLALKDQPQAADTIKKYWTLNLYTLNRLNP